ncbi:spinster family MFS transporter [Eilatimonas milleporae]|uniref:Putative MFS family arabinose efflux permease n=1 Tax=Eilatimonas milleporae TaxID=911205 RepID=A0A3M0C6A1_9PROT|nr:MFS transporter [Eilatimonas milleporae]RMB04762.1 putative MFS family arabinose efflux permease [Eilatimonas milleporae]
MSILATSVTAPSSSGFGSRGYRTYVLSTLTFIYTLNFVDRVLISVVGRPIIDEFGLSNLQFGALTGIGFALFYTFLGIPIARLSERVSRVRIIGACVVLWSVATVLCGYTIGFLTLLLARLAVGVGEAGCTPPANSLISDYYRPEQRPVALGVYAMGVMLGGFVAQLAGGFILKIMTWRDAFIYIGAPGILIGIIFLLTVKEPPRGYTEPPGVKRVARATLKETLSEIAGKPTFWLIALGTSMATFAGYGLASFKSLYAQYSFGLTPGDAAIYYIAPIYLASALGMPFSGILIQRFSKKYPLAPIWVPALSFIVSTPLLIMGYLAGTVQMMLLALIAAGLFQYFYIGASYNVVQSIVNPRTRATAIAILLFIINLVGYGAGPTIVGAFADVFTSAKINALGVADILSVKCSLGDSHLSAELLKNCVEAKAYGTKWASVLGALVFLLSGALYFLAGRFYEKDIRHKVR